MKSLFIVSLLLLLPCAFASNARDVGMEVAAKLDVTELTLLDAVNFALEHNLDLQAAFLAREGADGSIQRARAAAYPNIVLSGGVTSDLSERGDNPDTYGLSLSVTQPIWRSGAVSAGLEYAKYYAAAVDESIRVQMQATVADVTKSFLGVLLSQEMVHVYEESVGVATRMLSTAQTKRRAGTASDYEVLRAEVEVATSKAALIKEESNLRTARLELLRVMGAELSSEFSVKGELSMNGTVCDLDEALKIAFENRPDIIKARLEVAMAEESMKVIKSAYGPSADIFATGKYENPDPNDRSRDEWNDDWSAGVKVSYTLFDGFERKGKLREAKVALAQAEASLRSAINAASVDVTRASFDVRNAEELFNSQAKNIDVSREALRMLESGHKVGKNTQVEVLDARSALTEAMGQYYNAIYAHEVARITALRAIGTLGADAKRQVLPSIKLDKNPLN